MTAFAKGARSFARGLAIVLATCLTGTVAAQAPGTPPPAAVEPPPRLSDQDEQAILRALTAAKDQGLPAFDVAALAAGLKAKDPAAREQADQTLVEAATRYARFQRIGGSPPARRNEAWGLAAPAYDAAADLLAAHKAGRLAAWLGDLEPQGREYKALAEQYRRYRDAASAGGWPVVPAGVQNGAKGSVVLLRQRLAAEGYAAPAAAKPARFDPGLADALKAFQARHGLAASGRVDERTLAALNVTAEDRAAQIAANLERLRWGPRVPPPNRIEVDIPSAEAVLFEAGGPTLTMKVVVGDPKHQTPMLGSQVQYVIFNPPWNVPASIASKEILPKAARDRGYLARHGYRRVNGQIRQAPGARNALGRIKFDFPNPYGVYLHDTPARALFARDRRGLSHGCVRLEQPRALAGKLLAGQSWTDDKIDKAIDTGKTRWIKLDQPAPVFILYRTAYVDADGQLNFRDDIYGWDAELNAIM